VSRPGHAALLRWYPRAWRRRYGAELAAMIEDSLGGERPTWRFRLGIALAGLRQRARQAILPGTSGSPADQVRGGYSRVLITWTVFLVAGTSYAKLAEHAPSAVPARPPGSAALAAGTFGAVQAIAVAGGLAVLAGAALAGPAFARFLRSGGAALIGRRAVLAGAITVLAGGALTGLAAVAHRLSFAQRNGGSWPYTLAVLATFALGAAALALWTSAGVIVARRLELSRALLLAETVLAAVTAAAMAAMTAATALWWAVMASAAPWFLWGSPRGTPSSPLSPVLVVTMLVMLGASLAAAAGAARAGWSAARLRPQDVGPGAPAR
jgi:hypothetical protein